ncbi:unnamed protein product [Orchesella dallaii]|uniref:Protein NRDE2 n=1 Tax=Orchesella dallaii TaxID=48710 RepID=A0ABP1PWK1_9HEXA
MFPPGVPGLGGPPPGMWNPGPAPWVLDNDPFSRNQPNYQQHQGRDYDNRGRGNDSRRDYDRGGRGGDHRGGGRESFGSQEDRRLRTSQNFPKKVFLEEVDLPSEFAFRLDTNCNPAQVNHRSLGMQQKSSYQFGRGIFGASEDEMSKVYSVFHAFRCKMPNVDDDSGDDESDGESKEDRSLTVAKDFISLGREDGEDNDDRMDISKDFDTYSLERKDGEMGIKERIEYYNKEVRNQPQNISLWKEFVRFQDKVFEQSDAIFEQEEESSGSRNAKKKKKSNRKVLLEKKIAVLEKALETNPKSLELHLLRLDFLLELYKPRHVLNEWKKLVTQYQQIAPFWIEYLLFSASELLVYTNSSTASIFETCFQKFRLMMNPQYPEFQRPQKFPLFIADITFAFSLLLKNAGFMEKAVAIHQAQLEFDFFCPKHLFGDETLLSWRDNLDLFEKFWDSGTPRFGENGAKGWINYVDNPPTDRVNIALPDSTISEFEDDAFDTLNEELNSQGTDNKNAQKPNIWLNVESCRSKLYWLPWRVSCSDIEDCEDAQRVVASSDIKNYICPVPTVDFISDFDRNAVHFRHIVNFLITLREDFLPHTQAVDLVCSPFLSVSLTESSSLFNEIYYWRRLADLYVGTDAEPASKSQHVFAPEGFKLLDLVSPNLTTTPILRPALFDISQEAGHLDDKRSSLLKQNDDKFMETFHCVVEKGIELLDPEFAGMLFEMFLRFEQKLTCTRSGDVKQRVKFAKGFMKQEKIRNSIGGYREMAMLEYFGGSTEKAIELLVKTIGITGKTLNLQEWDQVDLDKDWKSFVDLVSLYHQLVQLYLEGNNDSKAYFTLVQLGNCFQPVETDAFETDASETDSEWKPKTNSLLKATRAFEKIMCVLIPNFTCTKNDESETDEDKKVKVVGSEVYFKYGGEKCIEFLLQQRNLIVEWTSVYALFQFFSNDFDAASRVFESVLARLSTEQLNRREGYNPDLIRISIREQLYINWCNLAARCLVKDPLMNSKFRNILGMALQEFPSSPPLLLLFTDVENQTSIAGKLWRLMMATMKQDSEKNVTHWAPLLMGIGLARKIEELERDEEIGLPTFGLGKTTSSCMYLLEERA